MEKKDEQIIKKHLPSIVKEVDPLEILPHLQCLSNSSREEVETTLKSYSRSMAVQKLYMHLFRYPKGFKEFVEGLRNVDNHSLADKLDPSGATRRGQDNTEQHDIVWTKRAAQMPCNGQTRISDLSPEVMNILAPLDVPGVVNWRDVAGKLELSLGGCNVLEAHAGTRPMEALLKSWSQSNEDTLEKFMTILRDLKRIDVLEDLERWTGFKLPPDQAAVSTDDSNVASQGQLDSMRQYSSETMHVDDTVCKQKASDAMDETSPMMLMGKMVTVAPPISKQEACKIDVAQPVLMMDSRIGTSVTMPTRMNAIVSPTRSGRRLEACGANRYCATDACDASGIAPNVASQADRFLVPDTRTRTQPNHTDHQLDSGQQVCSSDQTRDGAEVRQGYVWRYVSNEAFDLKKVEIEEHDMKQACSRSLVNQISYEHNFDRTDSCECSSLDITSSLSSLSCPSVGDTQDVHVCQPTDDTSKIHHDDKDFIASNISSNGNVDLDRSLSECSPLSLGSLNEETVNAENVSEDELSAMRKTGEKYLPLPDYSAIEDDDLYANSGDGSSSVSRLSSKASSLQKLQMPDAIVHPELGDGGRFQNELETPDVVSYENDLETPECYGSMNVSFTGHCIIAQCTDQNENEESFTANVELDCSMPVIDINKQVNKAPSAEAFSDRAYSNPSSSSSSICKPEPDLFSFGPRAKNVQ